jgi:hypothetical protein
MTLVMKRVRAVSFAASEHLIDKSTVFCHRDVHKYTWTSPEGQMHNQIDHF